MAKIRKMLDDLTGQTEEREKAKKEAALLVEQAKMKLDVLEKKLEDLFRNKELEGQIQIVGDRMGAFAREYRVNYEDGAISDAINDLVGQIMDIGSAKAQEIISKALSNALNAMFSNVTTAEEEKRMFIVLLEKVAVVRYDMYIWRKSESDSGLFKHAESIVAFTYARSVVDHTKMSDDELNDAIARSLGGATLQEIMEYKRNLIDLFGLKATAPVQNTLKAPGVSFAKAMVTCVDDAQQSGAVFSTENIHNLARLLRQRPPVSVQEAASIMQVKESRDTAFANSLCAEMLKK